MCWKCGGSAGSNCLVTHQSGRGGTGEKPAGKNERPCPPPVSPKTWDSAGTLGRDGVETRGIILTNATPRHPAPTILVIHKNGTHPFHRMSFKCPGGPVPVETMKGQTTKP